MMFLAALDHHIRRTGAVILAALAERCSGRADYEMGDYLEASREELVEREAEEEVRDVPAGVSAPQAAPPVGLCLFCDLPRGHGGAHLGCTCLACLECTLTDPSSTTPTQAGSQRVDGEGGDADSSIHREPASPHPDLMQFRIDSIRDMCQTFVAMESGFGHGGGLSNRAWLAQTVLNILDGNIDDQAPRPSRFGHLGEGGLW